MKILFFDIDGTIVDKRRGIEQIPETLKDELRRIKDLGHKVFICSGRPKAMIDERFKIDLFDGYILANGGYVEINNESIYEERMNYELSKEVVSLLKENHCDYMIETCDHIYVNNKNNELYEFFSKVGMEKIFSFDYDEDEALKKTIKIEINVLNEKKEIVEKALKNSFGYVINFDEHGTDNAFEIYSPTLSKAVGIQKVCDYYNVTIDDTYGFGDGVNDLDMIKLCHVGVAMGNAVESLKEIADIVCDTIENDGLTKILKDLF